MSRRLTLFLLSLFVSLAAFAAPPLVTFEGDGVYAAVPAGHRVAWASSRTSAPKAGLVADSDNDGRVKLAASLDAAWIAVDVDSGEWTSGDIRTWPLDDVTILPDPSGEHSGISVPNAYEKGDGSIPLWVRPGKGAWSLPTGYGAPSTLFAGDGSALVDATKLTPLASSPATPRGFEHGDFLFLLSTSNLHAGLADPSLDNASYPGYLSLQLRDRDSSVEEGSDFEIYVLRRGGTAGTVSVRCTIGGTAEAGADYLPTQPMTIVFGPGEYAKKVPMELLDDAAYNLAQRTVELMLSNASGGATVYQYQPVRVWLKDDDPKPVLSMGNLPATVAEGDTNWFLDVPVFISGAYRGGALLVTLYRDSFEQGHLNVPPGQTHAILQLPIYANDNRSDRDRVMTISVGSYSATSVDATRTLTVIDDDPPTVALRDVQAGEDSFEVYVPVSTQWSLAENGSVSWRTADGTAKAGADYVASQGVTTLLEYASIKISLIQDELAEGPEVFYIDVIGVSGKMLPPARTRYEITILDEDEAPPAVSVTPVTVTEEDITHGAPMLVKLATPSRSIVTLTFEETDNSTTTRYKDLLPPGSVTFQPGETEKQASVTIYGDEAGEPDEVAEIAVLDKNRNVVAKTTVTILDDDMSTTPVVSFSAAPVIEGDAGEKIVTITARLAYALPLTVSMAISSKNGTATTADYVPLAQGLKFLTGETEKQFNLTILGDELVEGDETVIIEAFRTGSVIATMTLTIIDDDEPSAPTSLATIADTNVFEKTGINANATFRVTLTPPCAAACSVKYSTENGTANSSDFVVGNGTLSFVAGQSIADIVVPVFGDATIESDEQFSVVLSDPVGMMISDDRGVATIFDDDVPARPILNIEDVTITEADERVVVGFVLRLSQAPTSVVRISYETVDETATAHADYEPRAATATFQPGQTEQTIYVPITGDDTHEETETFALRLFNGSGAAVPKLSATCTITDNDPARSKRRTTRH